MRRRSDAGGEPVKTRRRKAAPLKRGSGPKDARRRVSAAAGLNKNVALLTRERDEALEQQTATSEVLSIIRRSPADAQPVFDAIVQSAARLCGAIFSAVYLYEDDHVHIAATNNFSPEAARRAVELREQKRPDRSHLGGRAILDRAIVHVPDVLNDPEYSREWALAGGWRAVLAVPLLRDGKPVGAVTVAKAEPKPFSDRQVQLLNSFADQALIAIENARLFEAEQQRTRELTESLEQQTATSEVLGVISRSPGDLQSVFAAMLENAVRICDATFGNIYRWEDDALHLVAAHNTPPAWIEARRRSPLRAAQNPDIGRMIAAKTTLHVTDATTMPGYIDRSDPASVGAVELGGIRTALAVPMLRENELIGSFTVYRQEVRPFTDKQIELIENFAAQAVIAIENARLLNELRQRTIDLSERTADLTAALEHQTATSEVLQVISTSPGNLVPVFATMVENAVRICHANWGNIHLWDGETLHLVATHNVPPAFAAFRTSNPHYRPHPKALFGRLAATQTATQIADCAAVKPLDPVHVAAVELGGARTALGVPMLKENQMIGAFALIRQEVRPFTEKQIALVENFAAQAVIAIENARLLNELRQRTTDLTERTADLTEALEQQTATTEVLRVISTSPGDLKPVFQTMLENATRICEAKFGTLFRFDGKRFYPAADVGTPPELSEYMGRPAFQPLPGGHLDRVLRTKQLFHTADDTAEAVPGPAARLAGARSTLCVPMLKDDALIGAIVIYRQEVRPFTDKQIELLTNFAAQAAIAIENTRLLNELRQSLEQQTATAEVLRVISSSPGELEPVFQAMLENATRICEANFGTLTLFEGDAFRLGALYNAPPAFAEFMQRGPIRPGPNVPLGRVARTKQVVHVADIRTELGYIERDPLPSPEPSSAATGPSW